MNTVKPVDWHEARRACYELATPLQARRTALTDAIGATLATDLRALCDVPHYASSAMDGWAVSGRGPWRLVLHGSLQSGEAQGVVTGGVIPDGASGILQTERGSVCGSTLHSGEGDEYYQPRPGEHIRPAGGEARTGDVVITAGTVLNPVHAAVAAVSGHDELPVHGRPRVGLVLTGDEVVTAGVPDAGRVRDTFGPQLPAVISLLGGTVTGCRRVGDDHGLLLAALSAEESAADLLITTGGTGSSRADHLHDALHDLGAEFVVDSVAMRPGGPSLVARLPGGSLLAGLPGNPLAAMMGLLSFAGPLLAGLRGAPRPELGEVAVGVALAGRSGRSVLMPYRLVDGAARPSQWIGSGMLRGLAAADGVLVCPPDGIREGETAETMALPWTGHGA